MEIQAKLFVVVVYYQCLLQLISVKADPFCGNSSSSSPCHQGCFDKCVARVTKEDLTQDTVKESIATQTNMCVDKCYAIEFLPLKSEDVPNLPGYSDAVNCLGRCAHPANHKYCLKGYLSSFFYCDCHHCCLQSSNDKKCVRGCHLWFLRQWSPKPHHSCRYREDLQKFPKTWCTDYCIFQALQKNQSLSLNDIPRIKTGVGAQCIRKCISLVLGGVQVDYDMDIVPCTDLKKCVTISVFQFKILDTHTLTYDYGKTRIVTSVNIPPSPISYSNPDATIDDTLTFRGKKHAESVFKIQRAPGLDRLQYLGYRVVCEPGSDERTENPPNIEITTPYGGYADALSQSYTYNINSFSIKTKGTIFKSARKFEIEPCTSLQSRVAVNIAADVKMDHEVYVKIADTESMFPLTAMELRNAMALRPEFSGTLTYVKDLDAYTIEMKGTGDALASYGHSLKEEDTCEPIQGCTHPRSPTATVFCRVVSDNSSFDGSAYPLRNYVVT